MMRFFLLILISISLWGSIGSIAAMKGSAQLLRQSASIDAQTGMEILEGDEILTKAKTRVQVILNDKTVVTIGSNTSFSFREFSMNKGEEKVSMEAKRGFFRSVTGEIGKIAPERFKIKTASATIGIRGTDFSVTILDDRELIKCYSGIIRVEYEGGYRDVEAGMLFELIPENINLSELTEMIHNKESLLKVLKSIDMPTEVISDVTQAVQELEQESMAQEPFTITPNTQDKIPQY